MNLKLIGRVADMRYERNVLLAAAVAVMTVACGPSSNPPETTTAGTATPTASASGSKSGLQVLATDELQLMRTALTDSCNVEAVNSIAFAGTPIELAEKKVTVSGWVFSSASRKSGVPAHLRLVDAAGSAGWQVPLETTISRPDVISAMHGLDSGNTGFVQEIDLGALPKGSYRLLVTFEDGGQNYSCDKERTIVID